MSTIAITSIKGCRVHYTIQQVDKYGRLRCTVSASEPFKNEESARLFAANPLEYLYMDDEGYIWPDMGHKLRDLTS